MPANTVSTASGATNAVSTSTDNTITVLSSTTDSDGDGLTDAEEQFICTTNTGASNCPTDVVPTDDTDGDGIPDGTEVLNGTDPLDVNSPTPSGS